MPGDEDHSRPRRNRVPRRVSMFVRHGFSPIARLVKVLLVASVPTVFLWSPGCGGDDNASLFAPGGRDAGADAKKDGPIGGAAGTSSDASIDGQAGVGGATGGTAGSTGTDTGPDQTTTCGAGLVDCGGVCVNTKTD